VPSAPGPSEWQIGTRQWSCVRTQPSQNELRGFRAAYALRAGRWARGSFGSARGYRVTSHCVSPGRSLRNCRPGTDDQAIRGCHSDLVGLAARPTRSTLKLPVVLPKTMGWRRRWSQLVDNVSKGFAWLGQHSLQQTGLAQHARPFHEVPPKLLRPQQGWRRRAAHWPSFIHLLSLGRICVGEPSRIRWLTHLCGRFGNWNAAEQHAEPKTGQTK